MTKLSDQDKRKIAQSDDGYRALQEERDQDEEQCMRHTSCGLCRKDRGHGGLCSGFGYHGPI